MVIVNSYILISLERLLIKMPCFLTQSIGMDSLDQDTKPTLSSETWQEFFKSGSTALSQSSISTFTRVCGLMSKTSSLYYYRPYFVNLEKVFRWNLLFKGFQFLYMKGVFCSLMNMNNMNFANATLAMSGTLSAIFMALALAFIGVHTYQAVKYRKVIKEDNIRELRKYKWRLLFGEFGDTHFVRYFYMWAFGLRRILAAVMVLYFIENPTTGLSLLLVVNLLSLVYCIISRPYRNPYVNAHLILSEIGVVIVNCELFPLRWVYIRDKEFYFLG